MGFKERIIGRGEDGNIRRRAMDGGVKRTSQMTQADGA